MYFFHVILLKISSFQMRLHVWRADRQGNCGATGVHIGESAAGSIRNFTLQKEQ